MRGTKGPKIRFPPGTFVRMADDGLRYEVVQLYRLTSAPSDWVYRLLRNDLFEQNKYYHRVWYEPMSYAPTMRSNFDGCGGSWNRSVSNQDMLRLAEFLVDDVMLG